MRRLKAKNRTIELTWGARVRFDPTVVRTIPKMAQHTLDALPLPALKAVQKEKVHHLGIWIVSTPTITSLNNQYRGKDRPTDVLSFSQLETETLAFDPEPEIGDVLVCGSVARAQAREYGFTLLQETQRLVVHGLLHLFGYDHETNEQDARRMFRLQDKILEGL